MSGKSTMVNLPRAEKASFRGITEVSNFHPDMLSVMTSKLVNDMIFLQSGIDTIEVRRRRMLGHRQRQRNAHWRYITPCFHCMARGKKVLLGDCRTSRPDLRGTIRATQTCSLTSAIMKLCALSLLCEMSTFLLPLPLPPPNEHIPSLSSTRTQREIDCRKKREVERNKVFVSMERLLRDFAICYIEKATIPSAILQKLAACSLRFMWCRDEIRKLDWIYM
ncbi:hypothetical protein ADUPG1_012872 [Aduncisulcus paluster]|uniref:Uncharacterized protein n=1 Tax=Aduncisulcus paluster TaxID=2918883 RepID=A0ABQ5K2R8_9EUKA|nr:hypothetical protein ADUPG1_012872 [Aduncisulcus paluster]